MGELLTMDDASTNPFQHLNRHLDYDVLIIGAGLSGVYSLIKMRELGLRVRVFETGSGEGGTWYWNRYPGARFDSESYSYSFSFSQEILDEWNWTEHFAPQPETLRYIQFICDKFHLHRDIQFNTRIASAHFQDDSRSWKLTDESGRTYTTRFLITCMGILNEPTLPNIPGARENTFKGLSCHTARWPQHESIDFNTKCVAIIGTGATAVQTITEVAKTVKHLTVFQRTPNWVAPLNNSLITPEEMVKIRQDYPEIFRKCAESYVCFIHSADSRSIFDASPEEREVFWEELYSQPGFGKWLSNYRDVMTDRTANALFLEFVAKKIRQRITDPVTAEKLIPKNHGFGTKRVPLESGYYEAYNRDNVELVDISERGERIERITERGIKTSGHEYEFDMIIYATGFDGVTGAFANMDIRGVGGTKIMDHWEGGPKTLFGLFVHSFPSMSMIIGPHQAIGNVPRSIEWTVNWVAQLMEICRDRGLTYTDATEKGVKEWTDHAHHVARGMLAEEVDSWMTGVNRNLGYKQKKTVVRYYGSVPDYRMRLEDFAAKGYPDLKLD